MAETWANIEGFPDHEISTRGRVRRRTPSINTWAGRVLKAHLTHDGYVRIGIWREGRVRFRSVHRLVAKAFIANPNNLPQVSHKDGNRQHVYVSNLEWRTAAGNNQYGMKSGVNGAAGVSFNRIRNKWRAYYSAGGKQIIIGTSFLTKKAALRARRAAVRRVADVI